MEIGDLGQWTSYVTDGGNLSASPSLTYWGDYGLQAVINDNNAIYVQDDTPNSETVYRARFYINPAGVTMGASDILEVFDGYNNGTVVFKVQLQEPTAGTYKVRAGLLDNSGAWTYTGWYTLSPAAIQNGWSAVEINYQALANNGSIQLWLNGTSQESLTQISGVNINNDARTVTEVRLGAQAVVTTTRGTLYFDNPSPSAQGKL